MKTIENSEVSEKRNRNENYKKYKLSEKKATDKEVDLINEYVSLVDELEFNGCPFIFWKANENKFKSLSEIARKYLGVR